MPDVVSEQSRPPRKSVDLARNALAEARAHSLEGRSFVAQYRKRVTVRARGEEDIVPCGLEAACERKREARLRRVVNVQPGSQMRSAPPASS